MSYKDGIPASLVERRIGGLESNLCLQLGRNSVERRIGGLEIASFID